MIYSGSSALEYLGNQTCMDDVGESSHWKKYHSDFLYTGDGFEGLQGFGSHSRPYTGIRKLIHNLMQGQFRSMGKKFPKFSEIDKHARAVTAKQGRAYDLDVLRQSLTLALFEKNQPIGLMQERTVCVIGDGYASMTALLLATKMATRVVLVNLTKTLLVDLWFLRLWLGNDVFNASTSVVTDIDSVTEALSTSSPKNSISPSIIAIEACNQELIKELPIDIVINIASMQEMNPDTISEYFDDLRVVSAKRKVVFYCCNREEKELPDGTMTKLDEYPWSERDKVLLDELCPWHQRYYSHKPPFFHSFDGPIRHKLVELG